MLQFTAQNLNLLCDQLASGDEYLQRILTLYGYPPLWTRPNTYETLVLTILEQQVSLASAYAAYQKLKALQPQISPTNILALTDVQLRACYFSRQKIVYVRELAQAILSEKITLEKFEQEEDEAIRKKLKAIKGIGNWTVDIYLLHGLQRTDILPLGDLALIKAFQAITARESNKEEITRHAERWRPYRSVATMLLWHYYIKKKNIKLLH